MFLKFKILVMVFSLITLISCGGDNGSDSAKNKAPNIVEVNLTANDQMMYNLNSIVAKEGDLIKVNFENIGKMPKSTMGHNFIILKPDVDLASFAAKAMLAKETEYIPVDERDNILVHSKLLGPGEKKVIEFTAPAKGTYKFICTFPGHYITMQGNLIVR